MSGESKWYLRTPDETFGPETRERLIEWAKRGRIQPGQEVSDDEMLWRRVEDVPFLDMRFSIDIGDGNPRGPFNKAAAEALVASGRLPPGTKIVETREPFQVVPEPSIPETVPDVPAEEEPAKVAGNVVEKEVRVEVPVEKIVEKEVRVEVPVEKIVEKEVRVEVPVEKIVEKEVRVEVPVEKIVEVEKTVVDETKIRELEQRLSDETRQSEKLREQVAALENELRKLPQTASEVAAIQAVVFSVASGEAKDIDETIENERAAAEEYMRRHKERMERLSARRGELLKLSGGNIEEMTRRALVERPEDPRTAQLRGEFEEFKLSASRRAREYELKIARLEEELKVSETARMRSEAAGKDAAQLRDEIARLNERLQIREKSLLDERQRSESMRQQQALRQQTLAARLAALESPSIGTSASMSTNQRREEKLVGFPRWMRFGK